MNTPPSPHRTPCPSDDRFDAGDWPVDQGRPLVLRLLGLLGAIAFLMLGLSTVLLPLWPRNPSPSGASSARSAS